MMFLVPLFIIYFGYMITPWANQTPTYNLLEGGWRWNLSAWVGVDSEAKGEDGWVKPGLCF